ncbi:MAG: transcription elongation factor, GreA/GreB family [Fibrobacteres bacterium]|nr:transcription elongation factor, GreA/GreB family [Fibrobacterota bacterium]
MTNARPISPEGMEKLRAEWEELWYQTRPKLLVEIAEAAAQGDRSENAEYIYGKRKLREIDRRLRQLDDKITKSVVVEGARETGKIVFGARIRLQRLDADGKPSGQEMRVQIVGVDEIDPVEGRISMDSPMGKALMGMAPEGKVEVITPRGKVVYDILGVDYP